MARGRPRKLPSKDVLLEMAAQGVTREEIAVRFGASLSTVIGMIGNGSKDLRLPRLKKTRKRRPHNLTGQRFGRLSALHFVEIKDHHAQWLCRCDCGNEVILKSSALKVRKGGCGKCSARVLSDVEVAAKEMRRCLYQTWGSMIDRCENPNGRMYIHYGGRGIKVCDRWRHSFSTFCEDMGTRPEGFSIERKDVNGDYTPENCTWANVYTQARNNRRNIRIEWDGDTWVITDFARHLGINATTARVWRRNGMSPDEIAERAKKIRSRKRTYLHSCTCLRCVPDAETVVPTVQKVLVPYHPSEPPAALIEIKVPDVVDIEGPKDSQPAKRKPRPSYPRKIVSRKDRSAQIARRLELVPWVFKGRQLR